MASGGDSDLSDGRSGTSRESAIGPPGAVGRESEEVCPADISSVGREPSIDRSWHPTIGRLVGRVCPVISWHERGRSVFPNKDNPSNILDINSGYFHCKMRNQQRYCKANKGCKLSTAKRIGNVSGFPRVRLCFLFLCIKTWK